MSNKTPQRFTGRAGSKLEGRVRRSLDAAIDSQRRLDDSLTVSKEGRLQVNLAGTDNALEMGREGLRLSIDKLGEKNREQLRYVANLSSSSSTSEVIAAVNSVLNELRRTKTMRGSV